jgi:hypothetical protein
MDAATIIRDFTAKGVQLAPTDHGTISIAPKSRLTDADRDLIRRHKAELLAELQSMNIMNFMNIDSGHLPPARIVHDQEPKFIDPLAEQIKALPVGVALAAPATVHCRDCDEFVPGPTHWAGGLGRCSRTADGRPPIASRGYGVCYPDAPRQCPDYVETRS